MDKVLFTPPMTMRDQRQATRICVYASSQSNTRQDYMDAAYALGQYIGTAGYILINGAGRTGCMGTLNDGCLAAGGHIDGVILRQFLDQDLQHRGLHSLAVCDTMRERKAQLSAHADIFVALPGGPGTWEEFWEVAVERQIGSHRKALYLVNIDGYYDGFVMQLARAEQDGMLYAAASELFTVVASIDELITVMQMSE